MSTTTTRSSEFARSLPVATAGTIGLCCSVYVSQIVLDVNVRLFTMCPRLVLYLQHYYRIISACFFHGSLMHIGMNMLSTAAIATLVERRLGTLSYIMTVLWSVLLTGILSLGMALGAQWLFGSDTLMNEHSLGFSGVMFHLLVLETNLTPHGSRSVFGFINVPAYAYPAVMLVVMQVIMPNVSFTGHLCGILAGMMHLYGLLDVILVKDSYLREMEQWSVLRFLTSKENFVPTPISSSGESNLRRDPTTLVRTVRRACQGGSSLLCRGTERLQVAIFGRGRRANSNIHMPTINPWASTTATQDDVPVEEDEENRAGRQTIQQSQLL